MSLDTELVQVNNLDIGLERARITEDNQIVLPRDEVGSSDATAIHLRDSDKYADPDIQSSTHSMVNKVRQKKHNASVKIKKALHMQGASDNTEMLDAKSPILANTAEIDKSHSRLDNAQTQDHSIKDLTLKDLLHKPVDTVKSKISDQGNQEVAANIAAKEIHHGQEVDLVNAATAIEEATTEEEKLAATHSMSQLLKERQTTYVRWSLDRHVSKIRVLNEDAIVLKPRAAFEKQDDMGAIVVDWRAYGTHLIEYYAQQYGGQYIGYGCSPPTPSKETLMPNVERLIVATSPFQEFAMTTRRVYRWENPAETSKYLGIYTVLWYYNLLLPGILSALLYLVLERRIHGQSMEDLREDIKHRENMQTTALSLTEFIEKQGSSNWAEDLLKDVGPWLMIQLADLANSFETIRNFYEWRKPDRTLRVLYLLGTSILLTTFTPLWLLIKLSTLGMGITFFLLFPLSVNFPEYRLLVSPTKRILWNIPTHAEWAIKYIQAEGLRVRTHAVPAPSALPIRTDVSSMENSDYGFYTAQYENTHGHLVISTDSLRFESKRPHQVHFQIPYDDMYNLEKVNRNVARGLPQKFVKDSWKDLKFGDRRGREWTLTDVDQRDEAFSQIVGFSRSEWQVVW